MLQPNPDIFLKRRKKPRSKNRKFQSPKKAKNIKFSLNALKNPKIIHGLFFQVFNSPLSQKPEIYKIFAKPCQKAENY